MPETSINQQFFEFLQQSTSPFHAVQTMADMLLEAGFEQLHENQRWNLHAEQRYFVIREDAALIAFTLDCPDCLLLGYRMIGAHTDSPGLLLKPRPEVTSNGYGQLGAEIYGGPLLNTWLDRDLSLAGRITGVNQHGHLSSRLIDIRRPVLMIPSLAIHLDRELERSASPDRQKHLVPIFTQLNNSNSTEQSFHEWLLKEESLREETEDLESILSTSLYCYDPQAPTLFGAREQFISGPRLDNLLSCFVAVKALTQAQTRQNRLLICSNHEEIGSTSTTGADSSFLQSIMTRIIPDDTDRQCCLNHSLFISLDNAHAVHPNHSDRHESGHMPRLNGGPVIKHNAGQRYATSDISAALVRQLASESDVSTQDFVMRNDIPCGSTIGPRISAQLGIRTVDVGAPSLAMHSIRETTGSSDPLQLFQLIHHFLTREHVPTINHAGSGLQSSAQ
ncbi:MAG: M18 family aminopeptidase [Desulfobulbaceae bacterium]|uniref:M18 family aminopeptidase n=1 Tax=Candidatus Desulfatifera sulfidica TaxID=2841691 RepID=A0A8J6N900_9BACT|nr:M18 family aminopeptidase [Candidatus Desulfatifera sulfidica]